MKHIYLSLLFLLALSTAFGQKDFREGYLIQNGDTVRGLLDYRGDIRNAQIASFKPSPSGQIVTYTSEEISGYGFDKEAKVFESRRIPLTDSANASTQATQSVFLNVLVKGQASLYYYRDAGKGNRYFLEKDTLFAELAERPVKKTDPQTGKTYTGTNKTYLGLLQVAFADCPALTQATYTYLTLSHNPLINIFTRYNQCLGASSASYRHQKEKTKITIGPMLLYSRAELVFHGEPILDHADFEQELGLGGGVSFNLVVPEWSEKLSLQASLLYVPYKFRGTYTSEGEFGYLYEVDFDLAYIKLPLQLRYTYPKGKVRPFVNAGLMAGIALRDDNQFKATSLRNSHYTYTGKPVHYKKLQHGLTAGAGLTTALGNHTLSLEGRFEWNNGLSEHIEVGSSMHNFNLLVSYGF
jgi:hypothetical protein